ncbi:MAG: phosphoribosylanthranilate isomerase [Candidatus Omnitrophota bacterium]|nr:phosphoribosylanthranilate isomerase [Candidatus Omnitrophota bacterium]
MVKIKICGITNLKDAEDAVSFGADAIGFVFADSPRRVAPETAKPIIEALAGKALSVGVFVNESLDRVNEIAEYCGLDAVQLHGSESDLYCAGVKNRQVIKAFRIKDELSLKPIPRYRNIFAYLLDTFSEERYGGTGKTFDWNMALKVKAFGKPVILSGGLGMSNVKEAIKIVRPYAVDISSSIEIMPGKKDRKLMKKTIAAVKKGL